MKKFNFLLILLLASFFLGPSIRLFANENGQSITVLPVDPQVTLAPGASSSLKVLVTKKFTQLPAQISIVGLPTGVSSEKIQVPQGYQSSSWDFQIETLSNTRPGSYTVHLKVEGTGIPTKTSDLKLIVLAPRQQAVKLKAYQQEFQTHPGGSLQIPFEIFWQNAPASSRLSLKVVDLPAGVQAVFDPVVMEGTQGTVSLQVSPEFMEEDFKFYLTSQMDTVLSNDLPFSISVNQGPFIKLIPSQDRLTLANGGVATLTFLVEKNLVDTTSTPFPDLILEGLPPGMTYKIDQSNIQKNQFILLTLRASYDVPPSEFTFEIKAKDEFSPVKIRGRPIAVRTLRLTDEETEFGGRNWDPSLRNDVMADPAPMGTAILSAGFGGCCIPQKTRQSLLAMKFEVFSTDWNSFDQTGNPGSMDTIPDPFIDDIFIDYVKKVIEQKEKKNPLVLIGHSFGGDSLFKAARVTTFVTPGEKDVDFLGVIDSVTVTRATDPQYRTVTPNIKYFYNRWQENCPWPIQNIASLANMAFELFGIQLEYPSWANMASFARRYSIQNNSETKGDQEAANYARKPSGQYYEKSCQFWEFCNKKKIPVLHAPFDGDRFVGAICNGDLTLSMPTKYIMDDHESGGGDPYLQQEMGDLIEGMMEKRGLQRIKLTEIPANPLDQLMEIGESMDFGVYLTGLSDDRMNWTVNEGYVSSLYEQTFKRQYHRVPINQLNYKNRGPNIMRYTAPPFPGIFTATFKSVKKPGLATEAHWAVISTPYRLAYTRCVGADLQLFTATMGHQRNEQLRASFTYPNGNCVEGNNLPYALSNSGNLLVHSLGPDELIHDQEGRKEAGVGIHNLSTGQEIKFKTFLPYSWIPFSYSLSGEGEILAMAVNTASPSLVVMDVAALLQGTVRIQNIPQPQSLGTLHPFTTTTDGKNIRLSGNGKVLAWSCRVLWGEDPSRIYDDICLWSKTTGKSTLLSSELSLAFGTQPYLDIFDNHAFDHLQVNWWGNRLAFQGYRYGPENGNVSSKVLTAQIFQNPKFTELPLNEEFFLKGFSANWSGQRVYAFGQSDLVEFNLDPQGNASILNRSSLASTSGPDGQAYWANWNKLQVTPDGKKILAVGSFTSQDAPNFESFLWVGPSRPPFVPLKSTGQPGPGYIFDKNHSLSGEIGIFTKISANSGSPGETIRLYTPFWKPFLDSAKVFFGGVEGMVVEFQKEGRIMVVQIPQGARTGPIKVINTYPSGHKDAPVGSGILTYLSEGDFLVTP